MDGWMSDGLGESVCDSVLFARWQQSAVSVCAEVFISLLERVHQVAAPYSVLSLTTARMLFLHCLLLARLQIRYVCQKSVRRPSYL